MTLGAFILWLAAFAILLLGAALALPVTVRASGRVDEEQLWGRIHAAWAWGIASVSLSPEGREVKLFGLVLPRRPARERPSARRKTPRPRPKLGELRQHAPALLTALRRLFSTLHARWSIEGQAGFDDPADTAVAAALVHQAALALPTPIHVAIEPDYLESVVRLRSTLVVRAWPGEVVFVLLRQWVRRDVRRALKALRS
jgi:hypothetical protein